MRVWNVNRREEGEVDKEEAEDTTEERETPGTHCIDSGKRETGDIPKGDRWGDDGGTLDRGRTGEEHRTFISSTGGVVGL